MPTCLICNKEFGMITESHMRGCHNISCKEYANQFNLIKGALNPNHSKNMSGKHNPRYMAIVSPETREKIRMRHKESKRFVGKGNPMFGKTHTQEIREKISKLHKGKFTGKKNHFFGKKHTETTKEKISHIRIERGLAKGENNPLFGRGHTEKTKEKISLLKKEFYSNHPEKHVNSIMVKNYKNQQNKKGGYISKKQIEIYELLKPKFSDAELNYPIKTPSGLYFADIGIPLIKIDLEYDSGYWHKDALKDLKRDTNIKSVGWKVIRIKDKQVDKLNKDELNNYVINLVNSEFNNTSQSIELQSI